MLVSTISPSETARNGSRIVTYIRNRGYAHHLYSFDAHHAAAAEQHRQHDISVCDEDELRVERVRHLYTIPPKVLLFTQSVELRIRY